MIPGDRRRTIDAITRDALALRRDLDVHVRRILDAQAGQPGAQRYETDRQTGHTVAHDEDDDQTRPTVSDPTGAAAAQRADGHDKATRDLRSFERALEAAERELARARRIADGYEPRSPNGHQRAETDAAGEPGCQSCARLTGHHGGPRWEPVARRVTMRDGSVSALCEWCRAWYRDVGRLPTAAELGLHHAGRRVPRPADADRQEIPA